MPRLRILPRRFSSCPSRVVARRRFGVAMLLLSLCEPAHALVADSADDVCSVAADPCNVTSVIDVTPGAVLDFDTRAVHVSGSGQFNFGTGSGTILSGPFSAATSGTAINARGSATGGGTSSGKVTITARRRCTLGTPKVPCVDLNDCQLGACGTRRCSKQPTKTCGDDANCQLGTCGANRRCSASAAPVRCTTNADCDYGTCPSQLTCANRAENPLNCSTNSDCDFGTCTLGNASITMGGAIAGNSGNPATVSLRAADSVSISKLVNLSSGLADSDGGSLIVDAATGGVTVEAKINATGGGLSQGGSVELRAGGDVTVSEEINVTGGDFDGGLFEVNAGRDISLSRSVFANSSAGGGFGGEVLLSAGRDLAVLGASSSNRTTVETNGHTDIEGFAGDGGTQDLSTGRHLSLNANTRLVGRGSAPDGQGSDMFLEAGGNFVLHGDVTARADGTEGGGGAVDVFSGGTSTVGGSGTFDLTGGQGGGGALTIASDGNTDFSGLANVSGGSGGTGGIAFLDSNANTTVNGTLAVGGIAGGSLEVDACRVTLAAGGKLDNKATGGDNRLLSRESMRLLGGSAMTAAGASGGTNVLVYRTAAKPPVLQGTVSPAPQKIVDPTLVGCPVCGNGEIDQGETCDDSNVAGGDGCSSLCQNEKCLQQTVPPGYPTVALCEDNNLCTADVCNTALSGGTCQHPAKSCGDAFACTTDTCSAATGNCEHAPKDSACNDGNVCTDDFCSVQNGCGTTANSNSCNDNNSCTQNDQCVARVCQGTPIEGCGVCGDSNVTPPEECDDGNATFSPGEYCGVACVRIPCGKPTNSSGVLPKTSDALFTLKAAVGQATCHVRVCDVDNSTEVKATDALRILRAAVGQGVVMNCPTG